MERRAPPRRVTSRPPPANREKERSPERARSLIGPPKRSSSSSEVWRAFSCRPSQGRACAEEREDAACLFFLSLLCQRLEKTTLNPRRTGCTIGFTADTFPENTAPKIQVGFKNHPPTSKSHRLLLLAVCRVNRRLHCVTQACRKRQRAGCVGGEEEEEERRSRVVVGRLLCHSIELPC